MKITDLKCAVIGQNPTVRINTDEGIYGYGQAENAKPYLRKALVPDFQGVSATDLLPLRPKPDVLSR